MANADLVITTITVPLDPKLDCANTDQMRSAGRLRCDVAQAFDDAAVYCVDDLGQYESVADIMYFFGLPARHTSGRGRLRWYEVPTTGRRAFLNMGIAMDDVALSSLVLDRATAAGGPLHQFP